MNDRRFERGVNFRVIAFEDLNEDGWRSEIDNWEPVNTAMAKVIVEAESEVRTVLRDAHASLPRNLIREELIQFNLDLLALSDEAIDKLGSVLKKMDSQEDPQDE